MSLSPPRELAPVASDPVFEKALVRFKRGLTKKQTEDFTQCTMDDVKSQIQEMQDRYGSRRRLINMGRLSKFIEGMTQLGQVVEIFVNVSSVVAFIWGPVKFLLLTASTWTNGLDCLLEVYGKIGETLPDISRYTEIYKQYPSVHTHLAAYYCDILEFHKNALEVFSRPGWKAFFHSAWKTFNTQFEPILKSLERHRVMLSEEKLTSVMEETQKQRRSIEEKLCRLDDELKERNKMEDKRAMAAHRDHLDHQLRIVENKIDAPEYREDHEFALQKRHPSTTGNWILSHPLLLEWLDVSSIGNRKIYLSGIPGAGKTVLTSRLINHLKQRQLNNKDSGEKFTMAYFYFKHHQPKKQSMLSMLLALLSQLISQDESLLDHVYHQPYCSTEQRLRSLDEVSRLAQTAMQSQSLCFIIVDGLDECLQAPKVLDWFRTLMSSREDESGENNESCIRLFISGQRDGVLETQMSEYSTIQLETATGHDREIEAFATDMADKIQEHFRLDSEAGQNIVSRVTSQAHGMFLYARLVLDNLLSQTSKYDLKQELKAGTFPDGLDQAYERVVVRVLKISTKPDREAAKEILGMIMCSCEPLHWREIQSKFCIDVSSGEADLDRELLKTCKQFCGSLVEVACLEPTCEEVVNLVHPTAKTYLVQTGEINIATENAKMTLFCSEYILSRPLTPGLPEVEIQRHAVTGYYGFHDYAVSFWWNHVQQVLADPGLETDLNEKALQAAYRGMVAIGELEQSPGSNDSPESIQSFKSKFESVPQNLGHWKSIESCEMQTVAIRAAIDSLLDVGVPAIPFCGPRQYRCPKPWCQRFRSGFKDLREQKAHINEHDLPFHCDIEGCYAAKIGFGTETDLKKHAERWHPKEEQPLFPTSRKRAPTRHDVIQAAVNGDLNTIKYLVERKIIRPSHQTRGINPRIVLHVAVENGHLDIFRYLVKMGAGVNMREGHFGTVLHRAIARHSLEITTALCDMDSVSLSRDLHGKTPLDYAVCADPFDKLIVNQLLRKGTPDILWSSLLLAVRSERDMAIRYLATRIDAECFNGPENILEVAASTGNLLCINALLSSGKVNPNVRNSAGLLPLHSACTSGSLPAVQRLYALTTSDDLNDSEGHPPIHLAADADQADVVLWILQTTTRGIDVNTRDKNGKTLLMWASEKGHKAIAALLIVKGADVNARDIGGWTSLRWALSKEKTVLLELLLDEGADVNVPDKDGWTPLTWALKKGDHMLARLLFGNGADVNIYDKEGWTPLTLAIREGDHMLARLLLSKGADVNFPDKDGWTPLIWAISEENQVLAELLIDGGADVNVPDKEGWTPLIWAMSKEDEAWMKLLLDKGADVNVYDKEGWTPLMRALSMDNQVLAKLVIDEGADVNVRDKEGWTPLGWAFDVGDLVFVKLLIDKGADIHSCDDDGQTPLMRALSKNDHELAKLLIENGARLDTNADQGADTTSIGLE